MSDQKEQLVPNLPLNTIYGTLEDNCLHDSFRALYFFRNHAIRINVFGNFRKDSFVANLIYLT